MAYFRTLSHLSDLLQLLSRHEKWLILINADPDAMASALALKRIFSRRVKETAIARVNTVTRPDNLAMIRYTHVHMQPFHKKMLEMYDKFALVDSQPSHHPAFARIPFSVVIDHHPLTMNQETVPYCVVLPGYGSNSTIMTEHLYAMKIRPGKLLATALQFGIKTDTASFERPFHDADLRAYQYLTRFASHSLLSRISRSAYLASWLPFFAKACTDFYPLGSGQYAFAGEVPNPDALVTIADFFMSVHDIRWVAISGLYKKQLITVLRSDGISKNVGVCASEAFGELGSAGGHKAMARAEFSQKVIPAGISPEVFIWHRLVQQSKKRVRLVHQ